MNWYFKVLKKYAVFTGRAQRKEYWMFWLFNFIIAFVINLIDQGFAILYILATVLPNIGVSIRRLHDINRNGWWYLVILIPIIGQVILIIFMAQDSNPEKNQYGENPKIR